MNKPTATQPPPAHGAAPMPPTRRKRISTHPRLQDGERQTDSHTLSTAILLLLLVIGGVILFSRACSPNEPIGIQTPHTIPMTSK